MTVPKPRVIVLTETVALVSCPYLTKANVDAGFVRPEVRSYDGREIILPPGTICGRCGLAREAAAYKPHPLHLICLHPQSSDWPQFLERFKRKT